MDQRDHGRPSRSTADGKAVAGKITFAESDTVLVFSPAGPLPYGAKVVDRRSARRRDAADGVPLGEAAQRPRSRPSPKPAPRATPSGRPVAHRRRRAAVAAAAAVGGGSWAAVETLLPRPDELHADRRLGHLERAPAAAPAGATSPPLKLDQRDQHRRSSRPYAKKLAVGNDCSHFIGGNPGDRLRARGLHELPLGREPRLPLRATPYAPSSARTCFFQTEKSYNGGHYVNLMNAKYDRVGIGVWVSGGRVRLVIDFYHP